jgi:hypothetical protein
VNDALLTLSPEFDRLYAHEGRPSIPPEQLLRALLLQAFYSIRSERLLMEQMEFNILYICYMGHALMPDRQRPEKRRITLAGDKGYDVTDFLKELRARNVTPHIAAQGHKTKSGKTRKTAIDRRTTRHAGYRVSQKVRKRVEEIFGWTKSSAGAAKTKIRGKARGGGRFPDYIRYKSEHNPFGAVDTGLCGNGAIAGTGHGEIPENHGGEKPRYSHFGPEFRHRRSGDNFYDGLWPGN